ncbi:MAG: flagellar M-ring protein FliF [Reinekea sp.]|jgi:flagellar M-ring protein FliF
MNGQKPLELENPLQSLLSVWTALDVQRRVFVVAAAILLFGAVIMLARGSGSRDMALLFGGLESAAAGDIINALDTQGATYEIRGNAIYVDAMQRDSLRMTLAGEGLPTSGAQGYELLDTLSGFGTTSQMFDAAYWRAKEGELARTILASPHVRAARVHISTPNTRTFQREQAPTAAVNITTNGSTLSARHIKAFQYLVAAAVQGLNPDAVAIIDGNGGLVSDADGQSNTSSADEKSAELRTRAERLLAARVGPDNAVVEVSVETVTESEMITERRFDPDTRVAISTDVTESTTKSQDSRGGDVTVASNLPDGDAAGGDGSSNNENSESRSLTNYEVNETQRQLTRIPGDVRRLTVAVLINDVTTTDADGVETTTPRTQEELDALQALVASAVGYNADRGDEITLRSMRFEPLAQLGTTAIAATSAPLNMMRLIQIGVLAVVALILGLFVVRPILAPSQLPALASQAITPTLISQTALPIAISEARIGGAPALPSSTIPTSQDADPVAKLRQMISNRESETIQILQDWMEQPEESENV